MKIGLSLLRLLVQLTRRQELAGPVLSLGMRELLASSAELAQVLQEETPRASRTRRAPPATQPALRIYSEDHITGGSTLWESLGLGAPDVLERDPEPGATRVHDLNLPVPTAWHGQYGLVVDTGATEHLFDVKTAWSNLVRLLRVGGSILHVSPVAGWMNHGFFQPSPCMFYDFYQANGFRVCEAWLVRAEIGRLRFATVEPYVHTNSRIRQRDHQQPVSLVFVARREKMLDPIQLPVQAKLRPRRVDAAEPRRRTA